MILPVTHPYFYSIVNFPIIRPSQINCLFGVNRPTLIFPLPGNLI